MHETTKRGTDVSAELRKSVALLRTLRDEVRLQIHLGGLEAKAEWGRLEPRIEAALERAARDVSEASRAAIDEVAETARRLRRSLR